MDGVSAFAGIFDYNIARIVNEVNIIPGAANEGVVAFAAVEGVVAVTAVKGVVAPKAIDHIVIVSTAEDIITFGSRDHCSYRVKPNIQLLHIPPCPVFCHDLSLFSYQPCSMLKHSAKRMAHSGTPVRQGIRTEGRPLR